MVGVNEAIIAAAAEYGEADRVKAYLSNGISSEKDCAEKWLDCFNVVENELALDYLPLKAETTVRSETGVIAYSALGDDVVRVLRVRDEWGNDVPFKLFPEYLRAQSGTFSVTYAYTPKTKTFGENSDYTLFVSVRTFAYGMAAEYARREGAFEDAAFWEKKYKEAITAAYRLHAGRKLRSRRWV